MYDLPCEAMGCVPRTLLDFTLEGKADSQIAESYRERTLTSVVRSQDMVTAAAVNTYLDDAPSRIFFCRPQIMGSEIDRMNFRVTVPTQTIRQCLGEALQQQENLVRVKFFDALRQFSLTCHAAGALFENWFFCFFSAGKTIQCQWVQGSGVSKLTGVLNLIPSPVTTVEVAQPPYLWIAPPGFPGIDGALVLKTRIYVFQVAIGPKHPPPMVGMKTFRGHLRGKLKNLPWSVVFVGHDEDSISKVARSVGKISFRDEDTTPHKKNRK